MSSFNVLGSVMSSNGIVEPKRAPLIPGMVGVKKAMIEAAAFGCTIHGVRSTMVAVIDGMEKACFSSGDSLDIRMEVVE